MSPSAALPESSATSLLKIQGWPARTRRSWFLRRASCAAGMGRRSGSFLNDGRPSGWGEVLPGSVLQGQPDHPVGQAGRQEIRCYVTRQRRQFEHVEANDALLRRDGGEQIHGCAPLELARLG